MHRGRQDADFKSGVSWPAPRFEVHDTVLDRLTIFAWTICGLGAVYPLFTSSPNVLPALNLTTVFVGILIDFPVSLSGELAEGMLDELAKGSYNLVASKLSKKEKAALNNL